MFHPMEIDAAPGEWIWTVEITGQDNSGGRDHQGNVCHPHAPGRRTILQHCHENQDGLICPVRKLDLHIAAAPEPRVSGCVLLIEMSPFTVGQIQVLVFKSHF
jgi:hypothetical protein